MAYDEELDTVIILAVVARNYEPVHRVMDVLCLATQKGDVKIVEEYSQHLYIALVACGEFPSWLFLAVSALLQKPEFLRLQGSWHLLSVFKLAWEFLSELQKESLLKVLETTTPVLRTCLPRPARGRQSIGAARRADESGRFHSQ
jgi:hypothetical protein